MDTGLFRFVPIDEPKTPPRPSTPLSTFPLGNTRQSKTAKPCLVNQTKPSAFRHERRWCEASTTHSHACEQTSRARLRRHFPNLMRYPSYAQRTSTTLPSCGKLQFLKTQKQREATPRFLHGAHHRCHHVDRTFHHYTFDQPSVSSQTNPYATHARKQHRRQPSHMHRSAWRRHPWVLYSFPQRRMPTDPCQTQVLCHRSHTDNHQVSRRHFDVSSST